MLLANIPLMNTTALRNDCAFRPTVSITINMIYRNIIGKVSSRHSKGRHNTAAPDLSDFSLGAVPAFQAFQSCLPFKNTFFYLLKGGSVLEHCPLYLCYYRPICSFSFASSSSTAEGAAPEYLLSSSSAAS